MIKSTTTFQTSIYVILVFFGLFSSGATWAADSAPTDEQAKKILKDAQAAETSYTSFKKVEVQEAGTKVKTFTTYQKQEPDGVILLRSEFTMASKKGGSSYSPPYYAITNRTGSWQIFKTKGFAVHMTFDEAIAKTVSANAPEAGKPMDEAYSLSEVTYNNLPCYKVTKTLSDSAYQDELDFVKKATEKVFADMAAENKTYQKQLTGKDSGPPKLKVEDTIAYVTEYTIDKTSNIIWKTTTFTKDGNQISSHQYNEFEPNIPLSDDLFDLPKGIQTKEASTMLEYLKITQ
jgi:hypothetical protein